MKRMYEISGQSLTPTLEFGDFMVADFGVDEFVSAVKKRPDVQEKMGIKG
jgi:glutaredoxin 3